MGRHKRGGRKAYTPKERLAARQREYDALSSDQQQGRKRPGSLKGRK